jgi:hypothetical protein
MLALAEVTLCSTGCKVSQCERRSDTYEGADLLPDSNDQTGQVIAALEAGETVDITWGPPTDAPLSPEFPAAPLTGPDQVRVSLRFQDRAFHAEFSYDWEYETCGAARPSAEVVLRVDSASDRLHAQVPGIATVAGTQVTFSGSVDRLDGPARGFEAKPADHQDAEVQFEVTMSKQGRVSALDVRAALVIARGNAKLHTSRPVLRL